MDSAVSSTQRAPDAASQRRRVRDGDATRVRRSQQQPQQQHFHRHRQARMLLPHGGYATGLLFTINPQHAARATREAQLYLSTLTRDLQAADARADDDDDDDDDAHAQSMRSDHNNNDNVNDDAMTRRAAPSTSTMSLLARELADAAATAATRPRQQEQRVRRQHSSSSSDGVDDDDDDAQTTAKRHCADGRDDAPSSLPPPTRSCQQWLRVLETHCKGYLFVCVPPPPARQLTNEQQQQPQQQPLREDDGANSTSNRSDDRNTSSRDAHVIAVNPRVSCVIERVFADLQREPRPLFRSCFRLAPVELCCCPTVAEMQAGVRALLALHFPVTSSSGATTTTTAATTTATDASAATPPRRTMHTIALQLIVKNNTGVAMQRAVLYAALHAAVPANRFIVLPPSHVSSNNNNNNNSNSNSNTSTQDVVAVVCVHVLHSTCCMGVQRAYTQRCGYNVHALGTTALELAHDMTRRTPRDADDDAADASAVTTSATMTSTATVFDITRDALARVHAARTTTRTSSARALADDVCATLEAKLSLYTYPDVQLRDARRNNNNDNSNDNNDNSNDNNSCTDTGARATWLYTCSPLVYTLADMARTLHAPAPTRPQQGSDNNDDDCRCDDDAHDGRVRVLEEQCRWLWSLPDGLANALLALTQHTHASSSSSLLLRSSSPSPSAATALATTTAMRAHDDDDEDDDAHDTTRFAFDAALYHERLCDALWLVALTRIAATPESLQHSNNDEDDNNDEERSSRSDCGSAALRVCAAALSTVVRTMVRCGVQRGVAAALVRRLSALPARCLVMYNNDDNDTRALVSRMTAVLCGALRGAQPRRFALRPRHDDTNSNTTTTTSVTTTAAATLCVTDTWHRIVYDVLQQAQQRADVRRVVVCTMQHLLRHAAHDTYAVATTTATTAAAARDESDERALSRCLRRSVTVELLTRMRTPRAIVRMLFADVVWPVSSSDTSHTHMTDNNTDDNNNDRSDGGSDDNKSSDNTPRSGSLVRDVAQTVCAAWGSAARVRRDSLHVHETLLHAVMYALLYTCYEQQQQQQQQQQRVASSGCSDGAASSLSSRLPVVLLDPLLRGVTLRMESVRAESMRTAAMTVAAAFATFCAPSRNGDDDVDGGGMSGDDVLHNTMFTSALSSWLAEEDVYDASATRHNSNNDNVNVIARVVASCDKRNRYLASMLRDAHATSATATTAAAATAQHDAVAATVSTFVRRAVAVTSTLSSLDPDAPYVFFVPRSAVMPSQEQQQQQQQETRTTAVTRSVRDRHADPGGSALRPFGVQSLTRHYGAQHDNAGDDDDTGDDDDATRTAARRPPDMTLRACYNALLGVGRVPNAQLVDVQRDVARGLRGLAACLSRLRDGASSRRNGVVATAAAAAELAPMVATLVPTLVSVAIYAPDAVKHELLQCRHRALVDMVVLQPALALCALATVMHSTHYGIVERVSAARVVAHAARALSQLPAPSRKTTMTTTTTASSLLSSPQQQRIPAVYPPIVDADSRHVGSHVRSDTAALTSAPLTSAPRRAAITVSEGRRGVTRRWGAAATRRVRDAAAASLLSYNALADEAAAFVAALLTPHNNSNNNNNSSSSSATMRHDTFWQTSDPYTPTALLHALCVVLQCVSSARHVAPAVCAHALPFCLSAATQHPHTAVRKQAWVVLGELLRSWCHAPPLYTIDVDTSALRRYAADGDGSSSSSSAAAAAAWTRAAAGSLCFDEDWLRVYETLQSTVEAMVQPRPHVICSSSNNNNKSRRHQSGADDADGNDDVHGGDDDACASVALLVLSSLRDLLDGARDTAWLTQQSHHVA